MHDSEEIGELLGWWRTKEWHTDWILAGRVQAVTANAAGMKVNGKPCQPIHFIPHEGKPQSQEEIERTLLQIAGVIQ